MKKLSVGRVIAATALICLTPTFASADWRDNPGHNKHQNFRWPESSWGKGHPKPQFHPNANYSHSYTPPVWREPIRADNPWHGRGNNSYQTYGYGNGYGSGLGSDAIWQGYSSGRLSPREVLELREKAQDVRRQEISYRSDGRLSDRERRDLQGEYQDFYHDLSHELNDGERRW